MSFRVRLFGITALIVALVLALVMGLSWSGVLRHEVQRLDERLCMEARRLVSLPPMAPHASLESDVADKLHLASARQLMMAVDRDDGGVGLRSSGWDDSLQLRRLEWMRKPSAAGAAPPPPPDGNGAPPPPPVVSCSFASFSARHSQWRAARADLAPATAIIAADLEATEADLRDALRGLLVWAVPMALAITGLGAWLLSGIAMRPVNRLRDAMTQVTQKALDQRLDDKGEDREFKDMITAFNTMLARLEASFHQASRFSADAAHELKTPLTILQGRIEQALHQSGGEAVELHLAQMLDEVRRLAAITRKLLLLSQADAGKVPLHVTRVDLSQMLETMMADAHMLAPDKLLSSDVPAGIVAPVDEQLVQQLFNNLVSNALRYSPPGGRIHVKATDSPSGTQITFTNSSRPISDADRQRFFDRFYRGDASHSREVEGSGLGLSLAREIARAHGGDLTLEPGAADEVRMRVWLPRA
ncbi:ATP-binding protein [Piscinibacter terrae]|nr:ATP-binding protein [Albitalea terrae]